MRTLAWFREKDQRFTDHPALVSALSSDEVIPLFILDRCSFAPEQAQRAPHHTQFLLESLAELEAASRQPVRGWCSPPAKARS